MSFSSVTLPGGGVGGAPQFGGGGTGGDAFNDSSCESPTPFQNGTRQVGPKPTRTHLCFTLKVLITLLKARSCRAALYVFMLLVKKVQLPHETSIMITTYNLLF